MFSDIYIYIYIYIFNFGCLYPNIVYFYVSRDMGIRGNFSEPKGIRKQKEVWGKDWSKPCISKREPARGSIMRPTATFVSSVYTIYLLTP